MKKIYLSDNLFTEFESKFKNHSLYLFRQSIEKTVDNNPPSAFINKRKSNMYKSKYEINM